MSLDRKIIEKIEDLEFKIQRYDSKYPAAIKKLKTALKQFKRLKKIRDKYYEKLDWAIVMKEKKKEELFSSKIREIEKQINALIKNTRVL